MVLNKYIDVFKTKLRKSMNVELVQLAGHYNATPAIEEEEDTPQQAASGQSDTAE